MDGRTYLNDRVGHQQLMAGVRKWKLGLSDRDDIACLTERASRVTEIPLLEDIEAEQFERILSAESRALEKLVTCPLDS